MDNENAARSVLLDWRGRLAGTLLGSSVAGGLSINILSGDYRWRVVVLALAAGAIIAVASWLHHRPTSGVARWSIRALLVLAALAGLFALLGPPAMRTWASFSAAALTLGAVLVPRGHEAAVRMLGGAAAIGIGLTSVVIASDHLLIEDEPGMLNAYGVALTAVGIAGVAFGQAGLRSSHHLGNGIIGLGAALGLQGLVLVAGGPRLPGLGLALGGVAIAVFGVGWTRQRYNLNGLGLVGVGIASLMISVSQLSGGQFVYGFIFLGHGTMVALSGFGMLAGKLDLFFVAQAGASLANAALGITLLAGGKLMYGVALLGVALAGAVASLNSFWRGNLGRRMFLRWQAFITEPTAKDISQP